MRSDRFIAQLEAAVDRQSAAQRKLSTVLEAWGYKRRTPQRARLLQDELVAANLYPRPVLTGPDLDHETRIEFSRKPYQDFENEQALVQEERQLHDFLLQAHPHIPGLEDLRYVRSQYTIPGTRLRADLVFRDRKTRELVICEMKVGAGTHECVAQLMTYLKNHIANDDQPVRGLLITGDDSPDVRAQLELARQEELRIDWYCYEVSVRLHSQDGHADH